MNINSRAGLPLTIYMDKSKRDIDSLIHLTRIYNEDIGMSFGLEKCDRIVTTDKDMPPGHIADMQTDHSYLGGPQSLGNHDEEARETETSKYHRRIRQILEPAQWDE